MPSPRRMKKSVRKSVKKTRKSPRKTVKKSVVKKSVKKSPRKTLKKSVKTKRSYRLGVKVSEGENTFDSKSWQEKAFDQYIGSVRNMESFGVGPDPDYQVTIEENGNKYTVFFNTYKSDGGRISYHPAKTISKTITQEVPNKDRKLFIRRDMSGQKPYKHKEDDEDETEYSDQPWKCRYPYKKSSENIAERLASCKADGPAKKGYAKKGGISRQTCMESCNYE